MLWRGAGSLPRETPAPLLMGQAPQIPTRPLCASGLGAGDRVVLQNAEQHLKAKLKAISYPDNAKQALGFGIWGRESELRGSHWPHCSEHLRSAVRLPGSALGPQEQSAPSRFALFPDDGLLQTRAAGLTGDRPSPVRTRAMNFPASVTPRFSVLRQNRPH